jgi:RHS repeat-associated protein
VATYGRAAVRDGFAYSGEFAGLLNRVYGISTDDNQRTLLFVYKLYSGALGRDPTSSELSQGIDRLNAAAAQGQGQTITEGQALGREIFASTEYVNRNRSDHDFVMDLYFATVQRAPDTAGWEAWTSAVASAGRAAVREGFLASGEFQYLAATLYREEFWLVSDQLGTPRMIVDKSGSLAGVKRHDYLPFGEEIGSAQVALIGGRTTTQGYTGDTVRQQFTQKERDIETGLDYFGARYYGSTLGRFTSPDPVLSSGKSLQPQSWNRYSYCLNDPLKYVDPNGLIWQMQTTVKDNVSTTTYKWVWQDDPEEDWERVTDFHPDVVGPDGRIVGLHLNPNGPKGLLQKILELDPGWGLLSYQDDFHVKGYEFTDNSADRAAYSARGSVDMMPNQAFDVGLFLPGGGVGRLSSAGAAEGTTTLYRAVGDAEFEQIMRTGTFEAGPNSLAGKWFAESAEHAAQWGQILEGKGAFKVVDAKIPTVQAEKLMRIESLDGIGPARYAELHELRNAVIGKGP